MSDAEIIASVEQKYGQIISWLLVTGDYATVPTDFGGELAMMPGAEYYLVAFGYDGASATTGVTKAKFTAAPGLTPRVPDSPSKSKTSPPAVRR